MAIKIFSTINNKDASQVREEIVTLLSKTPDSVDVDEHVVKIVGPFTAGDFDSIESNVINT